MIPAYEPAPFGITPKLIDALANPVRLEILKELQWGDASPATFANATGVELGYASRCFRQLAASGYLEVSEVRRSPRGGAPRERIYRETKRSVLPASGSMVNPQVMNPMVHPLVGRLSRHFAEAIDAGTIDSETNAWLVYVKKALAKDAWEELVSLLDDLDRQLAVLEVEAGERVLAGESEPMTITVGLSALKRPHPPLLTLSQPEGLFAEKRSAGRNEGTDALTTSIVAPEVAKSLSNRWRSRILMELAVRPLSPSQFVEEIGGDSSYIARCFRELDAWGLAKVAEERRGGRRGGGVERIYRIARLPHFDDATWRVLPRSMRKEASVAILAAYTTEIGEAIGTGALAAPGGHCLTCRHLVLDCHAWQTIHSRLRFILDRLSALEQESIGRNGGTVDGLVPALVGLFSFPSPGSPR